MTKVLEARGLCAGYGSFPAISDVDIEVKAGEIVCLLGANGAGKTTTLLALSGLIGRFSGQVNLFGDSAPRSVHQAARLGLAILPEQRAVFSGLSVADNLKLGQGNVGEALEHFPELNGRLSVRAGLLSGGEQQMLAMARILAARPKLILADELSLGLAPLVVKRLLQALRDAAANGAGVIVVEQHPHMALRWSDRAYVMRRGRVELEGRSEALAQQSSMLSNLYL